MDDPYLDTSEFLERLQSEPARDLLLQQAILHLLHSIAEFDFCDFTPFAKDDDNKIATTDKIDLIIPLKASEDKWGIYCTYHAPSTTMRAHHIRPFLMACKEANLAGSLIISTTNNWEDEACDLLTLASLPVKRFWFSQFQSKSMRWHFDELTDSYEMPSLRDQPSQLAQEQVIETLSCFLHKDACRLTIANPEHQALMALMVTEKALPKDGHVLMICDDLARIMACFKIVTSERSINQRVMAICEDNKPYLTADLLASTLTNPDEIAHFLSTPALKIKGIYGQEYNRISITFCDASFLGTIIAAQQTGAPPFDLAIMMTSERHYRAQTMRQLRQIHTLKKLFIADKMKQIDVRPMVFGNKP